MQIIDIELKMPLQDFKDSFQECVDNWTHNINYNIKSVSTKMGRNMYKLEIDNGNNSTMEIVAEKDDITGNIYFHPFKLYNMGENFYQYYYADIDIRGRHEDPTMFACWAFKEICQNNKAIIAYIDANNNAFLVKDGTIHNKISLAIVDSNGNIYSSFKAKSISSLGDDDIDFHVKKPINEWLQEHKEVSTAIAKLPLNQKMDYIGKYLINARVNDEIDTSEFADIFCQAGLFGFSEQSVLNIYKLFM